MTTAGFVRSGAIYGVANVVSAGVPFLLLPILTRVLEPSEYGEVITFFMLVSLCAAFAGFGLHAAVGVRWLAPEKGDAKSYTASALLLVFVTTAATAVFCALLAPKFGLALSPSLCALAAIVSGANVVQSMRFAIWQSCHQPVPAAMLQVAAATVNIGLSLLGVLILQLGADGRILGASLAGMIIMLACTWSMFRSRIATRPARGDVPALLRFGVPLIPHVFAAAVLTTADRFAVASQLSAGAMGIYGAASQLGLIINVISDAANKAYVPFMYRILQRSSARSKLKLVAITYVSIPFWVLTAFLIWITCIFAGQWVLGEAYVHATSLMIWFLLGGAANAVYLSISGFFFFTGATEWISAASVSAALVASVLATVLVNYYGVLGGGIAYFLAHVVLCAVAWGLAHWRMPMPWGSPVLAARVLLRSLRQR